MTENGEGKREGGENRGSPSTVTDKSSQSRHCPLLWKISDWDMFDDNGVSLEKLRQIMNRGFVKSLTKDQ